MHAQSKPPVELASLLSMMDSPSPLAILPCMGNRQSNWRVRSRRVQRLGLGCSRGWQASQGQGAGAVCTQGSTIRAGGLQEELAITIGDLPVEKKLPL
ncbi:hypothetical protein GmHk_18G051212 [Glycine max]|nr:hypothetical protein GmHk_18G051212 [Glycine max]